jgi:hypothetical protein
VLDTTQLSLDDAVQQVVKLVERRMTGAGSA